MLLKSHTLRLDEASFLNIQVTPLGAGLQICIWDTNEIHLGFDNITKFRMLYTMYSEETCRRCFSAVATGHNKPHIYIY